MMSKEKALLTRSGNCEEAAAAQPHDVGGLHMHLERNNRISALHATLLNKRTIQQSDLA